MKVILCRRWLLPMVTNLHRESSLPLRGDLGLMRIPHKLPFHLRAIIHRALARAFLSGQMGYDSGYRIYQQGVG